MSFPLNPAQREAVRYLDGPLLVLAGAGSGKTRVIAAKIGHLIERGHDPKRIAAITFTNRAAREMRERVRRSCWRRAAGAAQADDVTICTFHALGLKIIRGDAAALGLKPGFSILDPDDIEPIVAELVADDRPRPRARRAVADQRAGRTRWCRRRRRRRPRRTTTRRSRPAAYQRYDDTLRAYQAVDFDDLIALPVGLLAADAAAAAKWRERCAHLLVDEYQDTNPAQYRLLQAARRRARGVHRGRRRRPGDLRLARRLARQSRAAAAATFRRSRS